MELFLENVFKLIKTDKSEDIDDINIFNILFQGHEEVNLHSRFISYLLSLKEHNFLNLFLEHVLKLHDSDFSIDGSEVIPNLNNKTEYEEIDILIFNENKKQAIIIENKINANASFHNKAQSGYQAQLERYFNTVTKGKDKFNIPIINPINSKPENTFVYYLTLYKPLTAEIIGDLIKNKIFDPNNNIINYYHIQEWLQLCLSELHESFLKTIINQYLNIVKKMTTDNKKALLITDLMAENHTFNESAFELFKHFKDIKWHTIHRFFNELSEKFHTSPPDEKQITEVAHSNKKTELKITFDYNGKTLQIVNDIKGFTIGNVTLGEERWGYFKSDEINKIKFFDFSLNETFQVINNKYRKHVIETIVQEVEDSSKNNFENLNHKF